MSTIVAYTSVPQAQSLASLRYGAAAHALNWEILPGKEGTNTIYPELIQQADVVLIQRDFPRFFPAYRHILKEAQDAQKPLIYDMDDLLIALPEGHPNQRDYEDALGGILFAILSADQVVVSSPLIRDILLPIQPNTTYWPTVLPDALWPIKPPESPKPDVPLKIGYMGSISHMPDLELLITPLCQVVNRLEQDVELHFWGCPPPAELVSCATTIHHPGVEDYADFANSFSSNAQADIWLAPLQPGLFKRCKSPIKFWEYSAVGGVGIYSDIDPYQSVVEHGENGLLAKTEEDWITAVIQLATHPDLRLKLARNAQQKLKNEGLLSTQLQAWEAIYTMQKGETAVPPSAALLSQTLLRYSAQIQQRSDERHQETTQLLQNINIDNHHLQILKTRSHQLDAIYQSSWWRTWQRLKKIAHLDFSPLPPYQPFIIPDTNNPTQKNKQE